MTNLEKYRDTRNALEAYAAYRNERIGGVPFDIWLHQEYVAPREPTLLEVAEKAVEAYGLDPDCQLTDLRIDDLREAVARERQKPQRNCDVYATAEEAVNSYVSFCHDQTCKTCNRKSRVSLDLSERCIFNWLYAEADAAGKEAK